MNLLIGGSGFLLLGLFVGWLVGFAIAKRGFGVWGDGITGACGALAGGGIFKLFAVTENRLWGSVATAAVGAMLYQFLLGYFR